MEAIFSPKGAVKSGTLPECCVVQGLGGYGWVFGQVETQNNSYFEVLMLDANNGPRDCPFRVFVVGRNVW